jgi:hypothetical protein
MNIKHLLVIFALLDPGRDPNEFGSTTLLLSNESLSNQISPGSILAEITLSFFGDQGGNFCKTGILADWKIVENPVLRIRNKHHGSEFFPSRIRIKEVKYFNPKNCF